MSSSSGSSKTGSAIHGSLNSGVSGEFELSPPLGKSCEPYGIRLTNKRRVAHTRNRQQNRGRIFRRPLRGRAVENRNGSRALGACSSRGLCPTRPVFFMYPYVSVAGPNKHDNLLVSHVPTQREILTWVTLVDSGEAGTFEAPSSEFWIQRMRSAYLA